MSEAHNLSISIGRSIDDVYAFTSSPENFPRWASGLATSLERDGDAWVGQTPNGPVRVRFTPPNDHGVLDHRVTLPNGAEIHVPMRVVENGSGSEVIFTLFRTPGMSDEILARDLAMVESDLQRLKTLLE